MTLIDYAKYLLNVCGRRFTHLYQRHYLESTTALPSLSALLTYLKTQTASIFTQIKARGAVHPLSGLPSTETLATIPTALATLSTRKVDVGTTTQIDDGVSLVRLLCDSTEAAKVTNLVDTNSEWTYNRSYLTLFPNATKINIGCTQCTTTLLADNQIITEVILPNLERVETVTSVTPFIKNCTNITKVRLDNLTYFKCRYNTGYYSAFGPIKGEEDMTFPKVQDFWVDGNCTTAMLFTECKKLRMPELTRISYVGNGHWVGNMPLLEELYLPKFTGAFGSGGWLIVIGDCPELRKVIFGVIASNSWTWGHNSNPLFINCTKLIHFEIGQGVNMNVFLNSYIPTKAIMSDTTAEGYENLVTHSMVDDLNAILEEGQTQYTLADFPNNLTLFIENFYIFIAKRLQAQTTAGAKTLTLSSAVATALQNNTTKDGTNVYTYITNIKKWTIATA